jgi:Tfp pilus assembly protein PilO
MSAPRGTAYIIGAVLALGAGGYMTYEKWTGFSKVASRVAELNRENADKKAIDQRLTDIGEEKSALVTELRHLEQGVPTAAYVPTMLKELEEVGKTAGITVLGVRPVRTPAPSQAERRRSQRQKPKAYTEQKIEVKGRGKFGDVLRFIRALDKFPKIVSAQMVSLKPEYDNDNPNAQPQLEMTIELRAFVFAEPETDKATRDEVRTASAEGRTDG